MPKRRYKSKWHRYGTLAGVIVAALGGVIMILMGVIAFLDQTAPDAFLLSNYVFISQDLEFVWSIVTIICGIAILVITTQQRPHEKDTLVWIIVSALLAILGGTVGGLITFGGALIYLLVSIL